MPTVPILLYHKVADAAPATNYPAIHIPAALFEAQMTMLSRVGRVISLADYLAYRRGQSKLPVNAVVLTFDDGYRDNYETAFPILRRLGLPATIFLPSALIGQTNVWDPDEPKVPLLDIAQIREMQRAGIAFESHTCTHPRLTKLPPEEALRELRESRESLEQMLGVDVRTIAYPWGSHDATVMGLARKAGYEAGVIVRRRTNFDHTPMLALRRISVRPSSSPARLAWDLFRLRWRGD
ncbi:MAG TPA: polysaccharide deacetylase family protein [Gemmatimonadaceae bacterium]|nr:polysaccharide deacetylase family protein [Gemmatimonadaceae bacterium]